jgi:hypothetical protein
LIVVTFIYLQLVDLFKLYFIKKFKVWNWYFPLRVLKSSHC